MTVVNSTTISSDSIEETLESFKFVFDENGVEQIISDKDLNSEESATGYANKEFLEKGTDNQTVVFQTYARGLKLNSIVTVLFPEYAIPVDLTKNRFIVKKVKSKMNGAKALDTITGIRYD